MPTIFKQKGTKLSQNTLDVHTRPNWLTNSMMCIARFTQGQRGAVFMNLTTKEKFTTVQGPSGTGKTIMMEAVLYLAWDAL